MIAQKAPDAEVKIEQQGYGTVAQILHIRRYNEEMAMR